MKKVYLLLSFAFLASSKITSQSLTSSVHNPVPGDVFTTKSFDSTAVLPKQTGSGQTWNFSNCITSTSSPASSTYTNTSSVPVSSMFPGANVVEINGPNEYSFLQTTASSLNLLGVHNGTAGVFTFTNPLTYVTYPFSMGSSHSDIASGNITISTFTGTIQFNWNLNGTGTGNIILPGNINIGNILQARGSATINQLLNIGFGNATVTLRQNTYFYFSSTIKQAILELTYSSSTTQIPFGTPTVQTGYGISVNNNVLTGLNENNFEADFQIFPNPGKDYFQVNLSNLNHENCIIEIYNSAGMLTRQLYLGNSDEINTTVDISDLSPGIYFVKTNLGARQSVRKLIKE